MESFSNPGILSASSPVLPFSQTELVSVSRCHSIGYVQRMFRPVLVPSQSWIYPWLFPNDRAGEEGGEQPASPAIFYSVILFSILNSFWVKERAFQRKFALVH